MFKIQSAKYGFAVAAALALGVAASLSVADSFTANRAVAQPGDRVELTYTADQTSSQDIYLVTVIDKTILFMGENGGFTPYTPGTATPARLKSPAAGSYTLLSFVAPEGFLGDMPFGQLAGKPDSDLLVAGNYDPASLRVVSVSFTQRTVTPAADGRSLYATHCAACHDANPRNNRDNILKGTDPQSTLDAIKKDSGGMGYLSTLSADEINAIAAWIGNPV